MKQATHVLLVVLALVLAAQGLGAITASANVKMITPLILTKISDLNFGTFAIVGGTGGTIELRVPGPTVVASSSIDTTTVNTPTLAVFEAQGEKGYGVTFTLEGGQDIQLVEGTTTDSIIFNVGSHKSATSVVLDAVTGKARFYVGGTLTIEGNDIPGTYTYSTAVNVTAVYE